VQVPEAHCLDANVGRSDFPPTDAHCKRGCTQYALKVRGVAVGALHGKFVLFLHLEEFEDFLALQTTEFVYRHGCFSFFCRQHNKTEKRWQSLSVPPNLLGLRWHGAERRLSLDRYRCLSYFLKEITLSNNNEI